MITRHCIDGDSAAESTNPNTVVHSIPPLAA
jgi:hypothetical protein